MRKKCIHCKRTAEMPGTGLNLTIGGQCARCYCLVDMKGEIDKTGKSLSTFLIEEPDIKAEFLHAIREELEKGTVWEGESKMTFEVDDLAIYDALVVEVKQERERETGPGNKK
jgi:hypothetical protein